MSSASVVIAVWIKVRNLRNSEIDSELLYITLIEVVFQLQSDLSMVPKLLVT